MVKLTCIFIGSVLTWHMYCPLSSLLTLFMLRVQVLQSLCVTVSLALFVITCSWIARIAFVSAFIHATYRHRSQHTPKRTNPEKTNKYKNTLPTKNKRNTTFLHNDYRVTLPLNICNRDFQRTTLITSEYLPGGSHDNDPRASNTILLRTLRKMLSEFLITFSSGRRYEAGRAGCGGGVAGSENALVSPALPKASTSQQKLISCIARNKKRTNVRRNMAFRILFHRPRLLSF